MWLYLHQKQKFAKRNWEIEIREERQDQQVVIRNDSEIVNWEYSDGDSDVRFNYVNLRHLQAACMELPAEIELPDVQHKITNEMKEDSNSSDSGELNESNTESHPGAPTNPYICDQQSQLNTQTEYL